MLLFTFVHYSIESLTRQSFSYISMLVSRHLYHTILILPYSPILHTF